MEKIKNLSKNYSIVIVYVVVIAMLLLLSFNAKASTHNLMKTVMIKQFEIVLEQENYIVAMYIVEDLMDKHVYRKNKIARTCLEELEGVLFENCYLWKKLDEDFYERLCITYENLDCY